MLADDNILQSLLDFGKTEDVSDDTMIDNERFLCKVYEPPTKVPAIYAKASRH